MTLDYREDTTYCTAQERVAALTRELTAAIDAAEAAERRLNQARARRDSARPADLEAAEDAVIDAERDLKLARAEVRQLEADRATAIRECQEAEQTAKRSSLAALRSRYAAACRALAGALEAARRANADLTALLALAGETFPPNPRGRADGLPGRAGLRADVAVSDAWLLARINDLMAAAKAAEEESDESRNDRAA